MHLMDPLDATMLTAELLGNPMHVGVLMLFSPPEDAGADFVERLYDDAVGQGIEVDPRLSRRPHRGLATGGLWGWVDVDDLELTAHVRRERLSTGTDDELWELVGHLHETPLPRDRPMWEAVIVEGLTGGRFALYAKVHHAVVDGISGFRMIGDSLATDPDDRSMKPFFGVRTPEEPEEDDQPAERRTSPVRNPLSLARGAVRATSGAAGFGARVVEGQVGNVIKGLTTDTTVLPFRAPRTRFNTALTPQRAFAAASWDRARIRAVQDAIRDTGQTVTSNDVVTAMVAGALRSWMTDHDELPGDSLVAICPVSVRSNGGDGESGGNAFGTAICNLGTDVDDPLRRLDLIHRSMAVAKDRVLDLGPVPSLLVAAPSILPTVLMPMLPFDPGVPPGYNLPISNVPGPREQLYWNGAQLDELYPVSVVYDGMALNVTVCSYVDRICFGYVAGRDAVPDVEALIPHTEAALAALEEAVRS